MMMMMMENGSKAKAPVGNPLHLRDKERGLVG